MQVAIQARVTDFDAHIAYLKRLGVKSTLLYAADMPGFKENGYPDVKRMRVTLAKFTEEDIQVPVMGIGRPTPAAVLGKPQADAETEGMLKTVTALGEVGIKAAMIYHRAPLGFDGVSEDVYWDKVISHWRTLVDQAERSDVRIANHAYYIPRTMAVWNGDTIQRLIDSIPSPYNGITYCQKMYMAGDDPYAAIERFRGRIFFAHARDLKRTTDPDYWDRFDETQLGEGDMDFARQLELLAKAGYDGPIAPEHLSSPRTPGESPEEVAVAYLQKLLG